MRDDYKNLAIQLDRFLEGKYGKDTGASRDTISRAELAATISHEIETLPISNYILGIIDDNIPESVEAWISESPVEFIHQYVRFINIFSNTGGKTYLRDLRKPFFLKCFSEIVARPESSLFDKDQVTILSAAGQRFNPVDKGRETVWRITTSELLLSENLIVGRVLKELELLEPSESVVDKHLRALDSFVYLTKSSNVFENASIDQLFTIYERALSGLAKPSAFYNLRELSLQLEQTMLSRLVSRDLVQFSENTVSKLKQFTKGKGATIGSFTYGVLGILKENNKDEATNPYWWEPLTLSQLVEISQLDKSLTSSIQQAVTKSDWFSKTIERHLEASDTVRDFSVALDSNSVFGLPTSRDLVKIWAMISTKSSILRDIEDHFSAAPVASVRSRADAEFKGQAERHKTELDLMEQTISQLRDSVKSLETALQRGKDNLGDTKIGLETGIARKFADAIARLIRRMEREAGKSDFMEILGKESRGLERLGIHIIKSGGSEGFDPTRHDPVGLSIAQGAVVTIVESGLLLSIGEDKITILKAVVQPN